MEQAYLYRIDGRIQAVSHGYGVEYPQDYRRHVSRLRGTVEVMHHCPGVAKCGFCGYSINIHQAWACSIPGEEDGVLVGGDCLDGLLSGIPVEPGFGIVSPKKAKSIMTGRYLAIAEAEKVFSRHRKVTTIPAREGWAENAHAALLQGLRDGVPLAKMAELLVIWAWNALYIPESSWKGAAVHPLRVSGIPVPYAYAPTKRGHSKMLLAYRETYPERDLSLAAALLGLDPVTLRRPRFGQAATVNVPVDAFGWETVHMLRGVKL